MKKSKGRVMDCKYSEKGVTLIVIAIIVIVVLILMGIIIVKTMKNNEATQKGKETEIGMKTNIKLVMVDEFSNDNTGEIKIGDYVKYTPTKVTLTNTSPIIQNLAKYSGNTDEMYNKTTGTNPISQETTLKWRVLDKTPEGEIRLISEQPTESEVMLGGAKGYNNGVKLLDDFCKELYSNTNLATNVQNLKIEDIEGKLTSEILSRVHEYYKTYPFPAYPTERSEYPKIWEQEIGSTINGILQNGTLDLSEQEEYISEGVVDTAISITGYNTFWIRGFGNGNNDQFVEDIYYQLFLGNSSKHYEYWLSSRAVETYNTGALFSIGWVFSGVVGGSSMQLSGAYTGHANEVRPVVTLKSGVKITGGNGTVNNGWEIE